MNLLDFVFGLILLGSVYLGFGKGFVRISIGLATLILAVVLAAGYYPDAARPLRTYAGSEGVAQFLGFVCIFASVLLLGAVCGYLATRFFQLTGLSWLNRVLGGAIGFVRGVMISMVVLMAANSFLPGNPPSLVVQSQMAPYLLDSSRLLSSVMPTDLKLEFLKNYEKVKEAWLDPIRDQIRRLE